MYNFHYDFMIRKFNARLLITDTQLCYELHEKNPCKKMYKYKELFDLSNFPVSSKYCCSDNKKVVLTSVNSEILKMSENEIVQVLLLGKKKFF